MPIVSVSRWTINQEDAQQIMRDMAPILKQHGATEVSLGRVHTGQHAGQILAVTTYPNGETFGRAVDAQHKDENYRNLMRTAMEKGKLQDRTVILSEEVG